MNHNDIKHLLSPFLDGELTADRLSEVQAHVETCQECRVYVGRFQKVRLGIKAAGDIELAPTFAYNVMRSLRSEREGSLVWLGTERFARKLVLGLLILVICFVGFGSLFAPEQPIAVDRYLAGEPADSLTRRVLESQHEISKDDVVYAALSR